MDVSSIGTGEVSYHDQSSSALNEPSMWTGLVDTSIKSDKKIGVVGLVLFDLRRKGKVASISLAGTNGTKFPHVRKHFEENIQKVYNNLDCSFQSYPADDVKQSEAYKTAIDSMKPGSCVIIFTPDPTHFPIALYAIQHRMHVLITKPAVQTVEHHRLLMQEAGKNNVLVMVEHHKREQSLSRGGY